MFFGSPDEPTSSTIGWKCIKIAFSVIVLYISAFLNISVFLIRERFNNKKVPISGPYFSSSRFIPIFILVGKAVLLVCIKSALIMSFSAQKIIKHLLNLWARKESR